MLKVCTAFQPQMGSKFLVISCHECTITMLEDEEEEYMGPKS